MYGFAENKKEATRIIANALSSYVKFQTKKQDGLQQPLVFEFKMALRHDLFCAQLTSTFKSTRGATITPTQKKTYIGRVRALSELSVS